MFRFLFLMPVVVTFLFAKEIDLLEFTCIAASDFSIELTAAKSDPYSTNILLHEFDSKDVKNNKKTNTTIDSMYLTISDAVADQTIDRVYIWETFISSQKEFELNNSLNQIENKFNDNKSL